MEGNIKKTPYDRYQQIVDQVNELCIKAGRKPEDVSVIAVSKTVDANIIQNAIDAGITLLGESRIQEAARKIPLLEGEFRLHMVGHLQSNKSRDAVKLFDLIHSIDKISTAEKVGGEALNAGKIQDILLQINSSGEEQKAGVEPEKAVETAAALFQIEGIRLRGLMTIGPNTDDTVIIRKSFAMVKKLLEKINDEFNYKLDILSMGMSSDYPVAIEEGATLLRIGTAIFGERD